MFCALHVFVCLFLCFVILFACLFVYSLDNKSAGRQSVSSAKPGVESDTDSMAEYGDGDTGELFGLKRII